MIIEPESLSKRDSYFFAISLIIPRPIAFVTSLNEHNIVNAAPFSYFNGISTSPPLFTISIADKKDGKKDTLNNILKRKEFCVNLVNRQMAEGVTISASDFPPDISEMNYNAFSLENSKLIKTPFIKESPITMECKLVRSIDDMGAFTLIFGQVMLYHVDENVIDKTTGYIHAEKADLLGRLGGEDFSTTGKIITVKRKNWKEYIESTSSSP